MSAIHCDSKLYKIGDWIILHLPKSASDKLSSRGLVMVKGNLNGFPFETALEPDGKFSHWFKPDESLLKSAKAKVGDTVELEIESTKDWTEPDVPTDIKKTLASAPKANDLWKKITPMARWEWIRWIRATNRLETRERRIEVALSKLKSGMRRPCCFNSSMCTQPEVSKNGVLLEPTQTGIAR